ncbi:hypothetical protein [Bacillus pseudomycoides]|uniref:hypothetical protein n=1 Tax=Bacillus pseudomycoides TaxID=64104 RepID=UPI000BECF22D|nr:hypothetical protein [Bacillus pseudomycoides]PDY48458.1 hypothetical protein CON79_04370 [Bacillus pseudomycoides]PHB44227.1 hypothetical protein COE83_18895 [Bacillus pseudomycoides]
MGMIKFNGIQDIQVDKERQKQEGIRKLEIMLTEEGEVGMVSIERYPFACNWSDEKEVIT